jgi:hypothetical protein
MLTVPISIPMKMLIIIIQELNAARYQIDNNKCKGYSIIANRIIFCDHCNSDDQTFADISRMACSTLSGTRSSE